MVPLLAMPSIFDQDRRRRLVGSLESVYKTMSSLSGFMIARALENEVLLILHLLERTNMIKFLIMRKMMLCFYECYQDRISGPKMGIGHNIVYPKFFNHINDLNFD